MAKHLDLKYSSLYIESAQKHPEVIHKLDDFVNIKTANPSQRFGSSDAGFNADGPFGKLKLMHAHFSHDISLIYKIRGTPSIIYLYGFFSHKESGTSKKDANPRLQKTFSKSLEKEFPGVNEDSDNE
jgi:hypothetical protein